MEHLHVYITCLHRAHCSGARYYATMLVVFITMASLLVMSRDDLASLSTGIYASYIIHGMSEIEYVYIYNGNVFYLQIKYLLLLMLYAYVHTYQNTLAYM